MENKIVTFPSAGYLWLCDDYNYSIRLYNVVYPSVRHAVLSWKTDDLSLKEEISKTILPADLKDLVNSIRKVSTMWKHGFIRGFFEEYTLKKFLEDSLKKRLLATNPMPFKKVLMSGQADLSIDELREIEGFEEQVLMKTREILLKQKAR